MQDVYKRQIMTYQLHLKTFDGPFDLLLHLIDKNEIDIYDIPIAQITREYLAYLEAMEQFDLEIASEFVVMAATLLNIKAKMLAPKPVPEAVSYTHLDVYKRQICRRTGEDRVSMEA